MTLRKKLLLVFAVVSVIPIVAVGTISFFISSKEIRDFQLQERTQRLEIIKSNAKKIVSEKQRMSIRFLLDENVQRLLNDKPDAEPFEQKKIEFEIKKLLYDYSNKKGTQAIVLLSEDGRNYSSVPDQATDLEDAIAVIAKGDRNNGLGFFIGQIEEHNGVHFLPMVRVLTDIGSLEPKGFLIIHLLESYLATAYQEYDARDIGDYCITDSNHIILSHSNKLLIGKDIRELFGFSTSDLQEDKFISTRVGADRYTLIHLQEEVWHWHIYNIVNNDDIIGGVNYIKRVTFVTSLLFITVCFSISLVISRSVTVPINSLVRTMKGAELDDFDFNTIPKFNNEIGTLSSSFEKLMKKLDVSMREKLEIQREKREAELKVLEFQVNPHFLYNTLSLIIWLANYGKKDEVIRITQALSDMFRISISRGREIITISEEVEHVKRFMEIEQIRYPDEFKVEYDLDFEIFQHLTIKLILQPIVENAIYHGVRNKKNKKGYIKISGRQENDAIVFRILDNGDLADQVLIDDLNAQLRGNGQGRKISGVGIRNVNSRIKLSFGSQYGVFFARERGLTVAEIRIPVIREADSSVYDLAGR